MGQWAARSAAGASRPHRPDMTTPTRRQLANAIRFLAADAVEAAKSGHPGMPMGMADIAEVLWNDYLRHNPADPGWHDRDRFVLSNGHGSMLHYALLHLSGYDLPLDELKRFRQLHSKTAGHPERHETPGVETTTGPLGQGFANAVGFALAEKLLAQRYNTPDFDLVDHRTWVFMGDGCMMEGVSHEAASLAGTWGLGKLTAFWDDNGISIDGEVHDWFTDDSPARFEAYGWHVVRGVDGHDPAAIKAAIDAALAVGDRPSLICCKTIIGFGAPHKAGKEESHGSPLGKDEIEGARKALDWPYAPFEVPQEIYAGWRGGSGAQKQAQWQQVFDGYAKQHPDSAAEFARRCSGELPADFIAKADAFIAQVQAEGATIASRKASQNAIGAFAPLLPELVGGSADLAPSNLTQWKASRSVTHVDPAANYVHYGVREFGMSAIANGIALHGGFLPFDATFLVFSDYARNALRMSALIPAHVIHVYTHDSIGLGEDGPTHQPVEHLASLRYIPNNDVWRPCDAAESAVAWKAAILRKDGPSVLVFSRQNLPAQPRSEAQVRLVERGGYVLADAEGGAPDLILIGTGSEVSLAVEAKAVLDAAGLKTRVVSMPSTDVFDRQDAAYRESVLPKSVRRRVAVEAGVTDFWRKYVGLDGAVIGLDRFGASAPAGELYRYFGITTDKVVEAAKAL